MFDRTWHAPLRAGELRLVGVALGAVAGAVLGRWLGGGGVLVVLAILGAAALLEAQRQKARLERRHPPACLLLALSGALAAFDPEPARPPIPRDGPVQVRGVVADRPVIDLGRGEVRCRVQRGATQILCVFSGSARVRPGDEIVAVGTLQAAADPARGAVVRVPPGGVTSCVPTLSLFAAADTLRLRLLDGLRSRMPGREGQLLALLVLGRSGDVDQALADAHRATGLSHLLAVSGAHISLLAAMLGLLAGAQRRRRGVRIAIAVTLLVYGVITGLDPPVFRALVAFTLLGLGHRHGRPVPIAACLAAPALLSALWWPAELGSASFLLSYAAVFGLSLAGGEANPASRWHWLWVGMRASAWASLTTMPLTLGLFGQLAPWTVLATPLLGPLVAVLLGVGLLVAALGALEVATADLLVPPLRALVSLYIWSVEHLAELPGAPILAAAQPPVVALALAGAAGVALVAWSRTRRAVAAACALLALPHFLPFPVDQAQGLQLLEVGHGQACVLRLPGGHVVVVDCGSQGDSRRATRAVDAALRPSRRIDLLVLTHGDADHVGGVASLLRRTRVAAVAMPEEMLAGDLAATARRAGAAILTLAPSARLEPLPGVILARPALPLRPTSNDSGLWVHADLGTFRALLPGDAEEEGVRAYLATDHPTRADVLLLPHHGRRNDSLPALLSACRPSLGLVSGGEPDVASAQAIVARRGGVRVLETAQVGEIVIEAGTPARVRTGRSEPLLR